MSNSFKDQSRVSWQPVDNRQVTNEEIKIGALQRIADATEVMAQNHIKLQAERDQYKRWYEHEQKSSQRMARRIAALQGVITKLKKKAVVIPVLIFFVSCSPSRMITPCPGSVTKIAGDTVPEWMHISTRAKGFVFAQVALSVRVNGICATHLDCDKKPFPVHYHVGWCQGKEQLFNRLVGQLK